MHKAKRKDDKNLVYIEKKSDDTSSLTVAFNVLRMYENDFNLTISAIADILQCERQWVVKYVKDNVKHIFLNDIYRSFLMSVDAEYDMCSKRVYLKDYYYFSRKDFYKWLRKNTVATKQTQRIDINLYSKDLKEFDRITKEYGMAMKEAKTSIARGVARIKYENNINNTLTEEGQEIYSYRLGLTNRSKIKEVKLKKFEMPDKLTSIKNLKGDFSLEIVYRELFGRGEIKYTIANSLVRYDEDFNNISYELSDNPHIITIPYEIYLKLIK